MLSRALRPATLEALRTGAAAAGTAPGFPDDLWAAVVGELAVAHRHAALSRDHLVQAAVPLYLGRVAAFTASVEGQTEDHVERELEQLRSNSSGSGPSSSRSGPPL